MYETPDAESDIDTQLDRRTGPTLRTKRLVEHVLCGLLLENVCKYCLGECEGCLVDPQAMFSVTTWRGDVRVSLADMIREVAPYKSDNDTLPERMCEVCIDQLLSSYMFVARCREADEALHSCLEDIYDKTETDAQHAEPFTLPIKHEHVLSYADFSNEGNENVPRQSDKFQSTLTEDAKECCKGALKEPKNTIKDQSDSQYNCAECAYTGECWRTYTDHLRLHETRYALACAVDAAGTERRCAVCLHGGALVSIHEVVHHGATSTTMKAMLDTVVGVRRDDELLSQLICEKCIRQTITCFTFITRHRNMVRELSAAVHRLLAAAFQVDDDHSCFEQNIQGVVLGTGTDSLNGLRLIVKSEGQFVNVNLQNGITDTNLNAVLVVNEPDDREIKEEIKEEINEDGYETAEYLEEFDSWDPVEPVVEHSAPSYEPVVEHSAPSHEHDVEHSAPSYEPVVKHSVPSYEPVVEHSAPSYEPVVEHSAPSYEPVVEHSAPSFGKKRIKTERKSKTVSIPDTPQTFECSMCAEDFHDQASLKLHRSRHPPGTTHICRICKKIFAASNDFAIHRRTHVHVERNVMCCTCGKTFESDYCLRKHMVCHNERNVACPDCNAMFKTALQMRHHHRRRHQEQCVAAVCDVCGRPCTSNESLAAHKRSHEFRECPICHKTLKAHVHFYKHLKRHLAGGKARAPTPKRTYYKCEHCDNKYVGKGALVGHVNKVHLQTRPFVCDICGKGFYASCNLKEHGVVHTRARPEKCETCGGRFVNRKTLVQHVRLHTGERPYECASCPERFLSASRRAEHVERVHEVRANPCSVCGKTFWRRSTLRSHVRQVHERRRKAHPSDTPPEDAASPQTS